MTYPDFIAEWRSDSPCCRVHTSGSTGAPKQLMLPKPLMRRSALRTVAFFNLHPADRVHSCISPDFIGGKMMAVRSEVAGLHLTWEEPSNRPVVADDEGYGAPALVAVVPSQMLHILERPDLKDMRRPDGTPTAWLIGGAPIDTVLRRRIAESGMEAWESYGMTETASHIALRRVADPPLPFRPLEGVALRVDERGCLVICQEGEEDLVTNDIVELDAEGGFSVLGRADNVIITGGKKVQPETVEAALRSPLAALGISDVMLTSEPDVKWGSGLILLVECVCADTSRVEEICRSLLAPHEVPKEIRSVRRLPRTPNGKLRR
ncbi:MAG: AMP-binding protein [Muribaculaceae bacterium]|nr:AMP-binding protein [Muribaculaceae bacterium]